MLLPRVSATIEFFLKSRKDKLNTGVLVQLMLLAGLMKLKLTIACLNLNRVGMLYVTNKVPLTPTEVAVYETETPKALVNAIVILGVVYTRFQIYLY